MKTSLLVLHVLLAAGLISLATSCGKTEAAVSEDHEEGPENGAQFKNGEGLSLTDEMKQAIGLKLVEVSEQKVAPVFSVPLHVMGGATTGTEATGWLSPEQAKFIKAGADIELHATEGGPATQGKIKSVEKMPYASLGDSEMTVELPKPLPTGTRVLGNVRVPAGGPVTSIPRSALLKTAEGTFAYTVNGKFYMRTPIKVGAMNEEFIEVTDGLYSGDQIVTTPVMSLWMAELQVLRGGKSCTCGH